ncbi:nucleotidyl transferase AbiEii/AbiGii toxin family protein [Candidatus Obscuribacterales bacterium]|nr:nucleotidyl transferase AbiEii/AbiGii toxin family protein [Candidatus Obscuribacterales bacterium]
MIDKRDILDLASSLGLLPNVVEKDYVLGWILAGIYNHPALVDAWVFKGGTCLKKCFFETYRFSEDLDFSLRDEAHLDANFLQNTLSEVMEWVSERSGLTLPPDQIGIDIYQNPRGNPSCQGKIAYRGPVTPSGKTLPKIKLDLTADEKLVLPAVVSPVFHPYRDCPEDGLWIKSYAYAEAFAEKVRALGERTRPRDLYDVVNLYRHVENRPSAAVLRNVLEQKCQYKSIPLPTANALGTHRADLEAQWEHMLKHQLPALPPVDEFWNSLPEIFNWIMSGTEVPQRARMELVSGEFLVRSRVLPLTVPARARAALEIIRFAAANHLCVDLLYDKKVRRIEPYSLRQTGEGNFVLHAIRSDSGEPRSYRLDRIQRASVTAQTFSPRYLIELTGSGPLPVPQPGIPSRNVVNNSGVRGQKNRSTSSGPVYVFRCGVCKKTFNRKSMNGMLNPHKHPKGYPCSGRYGTLVRTKY